MKKLSTLFACTLFTLASCIPQKASANVLLETAKAASTVAGFGIGSATLLAGTMACAFSYDDPNQGKRHSCMRLTIAGCIAAGLAVSGCLIAMGNKDMAEKILNDIITKR